MDRRVMTRSMHAAAAGDRWANIHPDLLHQILSHLRPSASSYASLRLVCTTWRVALVTAPSSFPFPPQPPFLVLPPRILNLPLGPALPILSNPSFFKPKSKPKTGVKFKNLPFLSATAGFHCVGSSHGWLILLDPASSSLSLLNPITGSSISLLPPLSSISDSVVSFIPDAIGEYLLRTDSSTHPVAANRFNLIHRAVLSSDPAADPSFLIVIFLSGVNSRCFTCRRNDRTWAIHPHPAFHVRDLAFYQGRCFAVGSRGLIAVFDFGSDPAVPRLTHYPMLDFNNPRFLVESDGELLLVVRHPSGNPRRSMISTGGITVWGIGLDDGGDPVSVVTKSDIGGRILFLGKGNSVSVSAEDFPRLRKNTIYFTHVYDKLAKNKAVNIGCVCVFDVERVITRLACNVEESRLETLWEEVGPWWLTPNLRKALA
ncbi:uncharacterized protein [Typha latifolia]|uniref:uncharacterized protein n=1 Tax=Typha latifolia TaxID=4733 RepID=UPI003C308E03